MALRTLDQRRAAYAWDAVYGLTEGWREYRDLVRKLPAMIQANGLGQTLAFLMTNASKRVLYRHLEAWLCQRAPAPVYPPDAGARPDLMRALSQGDSLTLRRATREAQALAVWLKRFAEARENAALSAPAGDPAGTDATEGRS